MGQPAFQQRLDAAALDGMLPAGIVRFPAARDVPHQAVQQQVARAGFEPGQVLHSTTCRKVDDRCRSAQMEQHPRFRRMTEQQVIHQRHERHSLATHGQVA